MSDVNTHNKISKNPERQWGNDDFCKSKSGDVVKYLESDNEKGLTREEVEKRYKDPKYGKNQISQEVVSGTLSTVYKYLKAPFNAGLLSLSAIHLAARGTALDAYKMSFPVILEGLLYVLPTVISDICNWMGYKTESPELTTVIRNSEQCRISYKDLTVGDIVILEYNAKDPRENEIFVDGRILKVDGVFEVDESAHTGEGRAITKNANVIPDNKKSKNAVPQNMVLANTKIISGKAKIIVTAVGDNTQYGELLKCCNQNKHEYSFVQKKINSVSGQIMKLVISMSSFKYIYDMYNLCSSSGITLMQLVRDTTLKTAEAMMYFSPIKLFFTISAMFRSYGDYYEKVCPGITINKNILGNPKIDSLGYVSTVCFDKTGTLTRVCNIIEAEDFYFHGEPSCSEVEVIKNCLINIGRKEERNAVDKVLGGYVEGQKLAPEIKIPKECKEKVFEFTHERRMMSTVFSISESPGSEEMGKLAKIFSKSKESKIIYSKGACEEILNRCNLCEEDRKRVIAQMNKFESQGKKVIGFAHKVLKPGEIADETNLIFDGIVGIGDPIKPDAKASISELRSKGIEVKMLTGDSLGTARGVAEILELGLNISEKAFTQTELESKLIGKSDQEKAKIVESIIVVAECTPDFKKTIVELVQKNGHVVAVVGDGTNDTMAFSKADVSIGMQAGGKAVKSTADIIVNDDSINTIVRLFKLGSGSRDKIERYLKGHFTYVFTNNIANVLPTLLKIGVLTVTIQTAIPMRMICATLAAINFVVQVYSTTPKEEWIKKDMSKGKGTIFSKEMIFDIFVNTVYIISSTMLLLNTGVLTITPDMRDTFAAAVSSLFLFWNTVYCREARDGESIFKNPSVYKNMFVVLTLICSPLGWSTGIGLENWTKILAATFSIVIFREMIRHTKALVEDIGSKIFKTGPEVAVS